MFCARSARKFAINVPVGGESGRISMNDHLRTVPVSASSRRGSVASHLAVRPACGSSRVILQALPTAQWKVNLGFDSRASRARGCFPVLLCTGCSDQDSSRCLSHTRSLSLLLAISVSLTLVVSLVYSLSLALSLTRCLSLIRSHCPSHRPSL